MSVRPPPPSRTSVAPEAPASTKGPSLAQLLEERDATLAVMNGELEALRATAAKLAAQLASARRRVLEASEGELVKLALVIAGRVVGDAVTADPGLLAAWAKEAVAMLPAKDTLVVAISADLAECVPEGEWAIATEGLHRLEIDRALPRATCEVRGGAASVEVSVDARIAAVGEAIGAIS